MNYYLIIIVFYVSVLFPASQEEIIYSDAQHAQTPVELFAHEPVRSIKDCWAIVLEQKTHFKDSEDYSFSVTLGDDRTLAEEVFKLKSIPVILLSAALQDFFLNPSCNTKAATNNFVVGKLLFLSLRKDGIRQQPPFPFRITKRLMADVLRMSFPDKRYNVGIEATENQITKADFIVLEQSGLFVSRD